MNWWPCFLCQSTNACPHREPEIRMWIWERQQALKLAEREAYLRELERKPPALAIDKAERKKAV